MQSPLVAVNSILAHFVAFGSSDFCLGRTVAFCRLFLSVWNFGILFEYGLNFPLRVSAGFVVADYSFLHKEMLVFLAETLSFFACDDCSTANSTVS